MVSKYKQEGIYREVNRGDNYIISHGRITRGRQDRALINFTGPETGTGWVMGDEIGSKIFEMDSALGKTIAKNVYPICLFA